ncbi:MAG TPA: penicillin acylase family protein [Actinomycetota bacterium]|nr:penicillin acylase family protein [Actinomycetota bacterium]
MTELTDIMRAKATAGLAPIEGTLKVGGLWEPVEVIRDRWGVPHIYARNTHDLYFAQAFVMASERLFQMEVTLRIATGRLSEAFGEMTLPLDRFIRTVGWNRAGRHLATQYDELSMEMVDASVEGTRAWIDRMPTAPIEYELLGLEPTVDWDPMVEAGASAAVLMAWTLSTNWDAELIRTEIAARLGWEAVAALFPDLPAEAPQVIPGKNGGTHARALELLRSAPLFPKGQGSNNWVVSGARSATGKPLLANDPHLQVQLPSIWFENHLVAPGINVRGVSLTFAPGVIIGHNERIAWGYTNVGGDTQDLYLEKLNEDGTAALYNGEWEPLTIHREEIVVRGLAEPEVLEVRETRHGPIMDSYLVGIANPRVVTGQINETYALRFVGLEESVKPSTVHRINTAENFEEFRAAAASWDCPGQNFVYADVDGNIGYQCTGLHPIRPSSDGTMPVPGWTDEHEWRGYVPFEEMPWAYNPPEGFLATANARPHGDDYPYVLGKDFLPPYRARRIVELITASATHDAASFRRIQMDTVSLPARELLPRLLEVEPRDDRQKEALALLGDWNGDMAADSTPAAVYQLWCLHVGRAVLSERLGPELLAHYFGDREWTNTFQYQVLPTLLAHPTAQWFGADGVEARDDALRTALDAALDELTGRLGADLSMWRWGDLHRVRFAGQLAMIPDFADLFTGGDEPLGGDEQTIQQGLFEPGSGSYEAVVVPSWRQIIDLSDFDASVGVHTVGQSGNPASPHFRDQFPLWIKGEHHPLPFSREAVEAAAEGTLTLVPEGDAP